MGNKLGVVSISFRKYSVDDVIKKTAEAGLDGIEWGSDVHCPPNNDAAVSKILSLSDEAGVSALEYGSYYVIGKSAPEDFSGILEAARALGVKIIRVWPGMNTPSDTISDEDYIRHVADAKRIAALAPDMTIALECHPQSLTDEYHHARAFLADVNMPNLKMFWQPNQYRPVEYNLDAIRALLPFIVAVHVFHWSRKKRLSLADGKEAWAKYIELLSEKELNYMLEFMPDDDLDTLPREAEILRELLRK